jgi:glycolate oxidase
MKYNYKSVDESDIANFKAIVGEDFCLLDSVVLNDYSHDETEDIRSLPSVVLKPLQKEEISEILKYCNQHKIAITPRGAGSGLAGAAIPMKGSVVLSMERFDKIIHIDERNLQVTVEPGVITEVLQNALKEKGLFYPPDPASKAFCFIGGNINTNSGGPRAVKYGVVKDYVLNLEIVLANGDIINTGANTLKNSTGYNLTQLIVGSEGTLGIVTKIQLRLIPYPKFNLLMLASFKSSENACAAVSAIFRAGITPSALEFMERSAIDKAVEYLGAYNFKISESTAAQLLIEVDGNYLETLHQDCEIINNVLENYDCQEVLFADTDAQKNELWKLRRNVGHAVKKSSVYKEEDTVVPRAELPKLLSSIKEIGRKYGFESVCYGHAGDGNLHVNILKANMSDNEWNNELTKGIREIFSIVKSLGGTISGEHGIGLVQKSYLDIVFSKTELDLIRSIKTVFDPNCILNPGKIIDL